MMVKIFVCYLLIIYSGKFVHADSYQLNFYNSPITQDYGIYHDSEIKVFL
jgi:hypothetical protein